MSNVPRHGAASHYVRPDRVGYTSVLQAIPGFRPVQNAQDVAWDFVAAPFYATGPYQFAGAFGNAKLSLKDRIKLFFFKRKLIKQQAAVNAVAALPPAAAPPVSAKNDAAEGATKDAAALAITRGVVASGEQLMPAGVVVPQLVAGARMYWDNAVGTPFAMAAAAGPRLEDRRIGQVATSYAWRNYVDQVNAWRRYSTPFDAQNAWRAFSQGRGTAAGIATVTEQYADKMRK